MLLDHEALLNGNQRHSLVVLNNIQSNSALLIDLWKKASFVVAADGTVMYTSSLDGISAPNVVCGDFDSVDEAILNVHRERGSDIIRLDSQNLTDLQKCIHILACNQLGVHTHQQADILSIEVTEEMQLDVIVFGAFGGRFDHEMSAIHELYRSQHWFRSMTLLSDSNLACLIKPGKTTIKCHRQLQFGRTCGLLPLGTPVRSISTQGLKWNLSKQMLKLGTFVSTSNCVLSDTIEIDCSDPVVWTTMLQSHQD